MTLHRQGDVLIRKVESLPEDARLCKPTTFEREGESVSRHVLAEGEVTGHAHAVYLPEVTDEDKEMVAELFRTENGDMYLKVNDATTVDHEEHDSIALEPGTYKIEGQREYTPEANVRVLD